MKIHKLHHWDITLKEATTLQRELSSRVKLQPFKRKIKLVAGADLAYSKKENLFFASLVLLKMPELEPIKKLNIAVKKSFPYVPGYLSFREAPLILDLFEQLDCTPDLAVIDGQGIAHPRGLGLASHIGLFLGIPTLGCAKSRLCGDYKMPGNKKGESSPIWLNGNRVGYVVRTRTNVKPIFVSPGHLVAIDDVVPLVLKLTGKYRIPEPTRLAHISVRKYKKRYLDNGR
mgnify:CR=1 FL=1